MKFMLLIYGDEKAAAAQARPDATTMSPEYSAYNAALLKAGAMIAGSRLRPTTDAASVRIRDGKTQVLDGPYAETREQFGGYYLIEADSMDAALDWAGQCPAAARGTIEIRPVMAQA